ncbi:hypothetical protein Tco_1092681 [Tanacetum coccineum]|uniref:Uncharacterized protein n=1 Tax=Tanacetum coccineum TaxID=301880 RepID=A0ABQ5ICR7_9ASTR
MKWLPKLMGFDYEVEYKQGKDNVVADALSRKERERECLNINATIVTTELYDKVKQTLTTDDRLKAICTNLKDGGQGNYSQDMFIILLETVKETGETNALYGQPPPVHVPYMGGISKVDAVDRSFEAKEKAVQLLKLHLERAQNIMKQHSDKNSGLIVVLRMLLRKCLKTYAKDFLTLNWILEDKDPFKDDGMLGTKCGST